MFGKKKRNNDIFTDPMWDDPYTQNQTEFGSGTYENDPLFGQDNLGGNDSLFAQDKQRGNNSLFAKDKRRGNNSLFPKDKRRINDSLFAQDDLRGDDSLFPQDDLRRDDPLFVQDDLGWGDPVLPRKNKKKNRALVPGLLVIGFLSLTGLAAFVLLTYSPILKRDDKHVNTQQTQQTQQTQKESTNTQQENSASAGQTNNKPTNQTSNGTANQANTNSGSDNQTSAGTTSQTSNGTTNQGNTNSGTANQTGDASATQAQPTQTQPTYSYGDGQIIWDPSQISETGFWYERLSSAEQQAYLTLYRSLKEPTASPVTISIKSDWDPVFAMIDDHPELFWLQAEDFMQWDDGYGHIDHYEYTPTVEKGQISTYQQQIERTVQDYLSQIRNATSDYEKIKAAFLYVDQLTMYNRSAPDNQNIISTFIHHQTVCTGYARTMGALLQRAGVAWGYLTGTMEGGDHAWDIVRMDGEWTYVDAVEPEGETESFPDYRRLGMTEDNLAKLQYIIHAERNKNLPSCSNQACNYYWKEDLIMETYSLQRLEELKSRSTGSLLFRCIDENTFNQFYQNFISGSLPELYDYKMVYSNPEMLTLRFEP